MERENVISREIKSVGYDEENKILEIEFKKEEVYQYTDVPKEIYDSLMDADSYSDYFHKHIQEKYPTTRMEQLV